MTSEEAKQKVNICEGNIKRAYSEMLKSAKEIGNSGYESARSNKLLIAQDAAHKTKINTICTLLIAGFGLVLYSASHPVLGVLLIILGVMLAIGMHGAGVDEEKKRIDKANFDLNLVNNKQSELNSVLDSNKSI